MNQSHEPLSSSPSTSTTPNNHDSHLSLVHEHVEYSKSNSICTEFLIDRLTQFEDLSLKSQGLPIRFRDLSVFTADIDLRLVNSLPQAIQSCILSPFKLFINLVVHLNPLSFFYDSSQFSTHTHFNQVPILCKADGVVNQSELLLVLARPKGGMTSLLRAISLNHQSFSAVHGHIDFGSLSNSPICNHGLTPLILMVDETDQHFSSLGVNDTLQLAAQCRTPKLRPDHLTRKDWVRSEVQSWSSIFGFSSTTLHTTLGLISGGEQKRVSIIETLLTRCSVLCLDNVTAGLDSVNSYRLIKSLKEWSSINRTSTVVGLRQASDRLYHLFDKVSVLYNGHQIYFGPTSEAPQYFHQLGFLQTQNQSNADFLCSVTDPLTRKIHPDHQRPVPQTPSEFVDAFKLSNHYVNLKLELLQYDSRYPSSGAAQHTIYTVPKEKDTFLRSTSPWTINYFRQLIYLTSRQYSLIKADFRPYLTKTIINLNLSLIIGSLFYQLPKTTEAAFSRGSILFLSLLFNGYLQLSELGNTLIGREIIQRHGRFGFYSPSALALARTLSDIPIITAQVLMFASVTYGLAGLQRDFIRFGIYILLVDATAINLTAAFRLFAVVSSSFDEAVRYCGLVLNIFVIHGGYFIPTPSLGKWLKWIRYYFDPISYAFEAVLSNEFNGLELQCSPQHVVPRGPSYNDLTHQTCSILGSKPNSLVVLGDDYIHQTYGFEYRHIWFNLGVIIVLSAIFLVLTVVFTECFPMNKFGSVRLFKNSAKVRRKLKSLKKMLQLDGGLMEEGVLVDCETLSDKVQRTNISSSVTEEMFGPAQFDSAVLTFSNLKLSIKDRSHPRTLLDDLSGYFQPGEMTALMGESGAGKTTLLNVLAGRRFNYTQLSGEVLIEGKLPTADSFRAIGYVEQKDYHDEYSTVKEALTFSALLRQPNSVPHWAKLADVDRVINWLGMKDLEDAIIGTPLAGLGLEDRKKLSIAIELVARPKILCLDEPISGMDSQSATHIMQLLRRLVSQFNLTVIFTVHQPSVEIFESFDRLILLETGGKMVYFGPRERAVKYMEANYSRLCDKTENPAEYLIDSIRSFTGKKQDRSEGALGLCLNDAPDSEGDRSMMDDQSLTSLWRISNEYTVALNRIKELNVEAFSLDQSLFNNQRGGRIDREIIQLTKRFSRHFWRDSSFSFTQIFTATFVSIIIGSSFFQQAAAPSPSENLIKSITVRISTLTGLSNQGFSVFLILFIPPIFMNQLIAKWFQFKNIYSTREKLNGSYREMSLVVGFFLAELPYSVASAFIFWFIWFFSVGFRIETETIAFTLVAVELFFLFQVTWAIWIAALSPRIGVVSNLLPFFLISMEAFNGSLITFDQMPAYWKWMYWVSPFQWYIKSVLSMVLHGQKVNCKPAELVKYFAPNSISCEKYSNEFLSQHTGFLMQTIQNETNELKETCAYCQYKTGDEFIRDKFKTNFDQSYTTLLIFSSYCLFNIILIFFIMLFKSGGMTRFNLAKEKKT